MPSVRLVKAVRQHAGPLGNVFTIPCTYVPTTLSHAHSIIGLVDLLLNSLGNAAMSPFPDPSCGFESDVLMWNEQATGTAPHTLVKR